MWPDSKPDVLEALYENRRKSVANLMNAGMGTIVKALHQVTVRGLVPRMEKTSNVHIQDAYLIYDVLLKKRVNLSVLVMKHMQACARSKNHGLPYPRLVKILLTNAGVYKPKKEVSLVHRFDAASLKKMNWGISSEGADMEEIHLKIDTLQASVDKEFAMMRKLIAELPSKLVASRGKKTTDDSSERTSTDKDEDDESE